MWETRSCFEIQSDLSSFHGWHTSPKKEQEIRTSERYQNDCKRFPPPGIELEAASAYPTDNWGCSSVSFRGHYTERNNYM